MWFQEICIIPKSDIWKNMNFEKKWILKKYEFWKNMNFEKDVNLELVIKFKEKV